MSDQKPIDPKRAFPTDVTSPMPVQTWGPAYETHETPAVQPPNGKGSSKDQDKKKQRG